jgi:hypothetical protein
MNEVSKKTNDNSTGAADFLSTDKGRTKSNAIEVPSISLPKGANETLLEKFILTEIQGKYTAIHAYDKMMWMVRSGFLTLVFAGWGFVVKAAVESSLTIQLIKPYIFILSAFSLILAYGAFLIDRNYARRKFRVITAVNDLVRMVLSHDLSKDVNCNNLIDLLNISGDADNQNYETPEFKNEIGISHLIYLIPSVLVCIISLISIIKY